MQWMHVQVLHKVYAMRMQGIFTHMNVQNHFQPPHQNQQIPNPTTMFEEQMCPPPPPPLPSNPSTKVSPYVRNLCSAPPSYLSQPPKPADHSVPAPTGRYFFYGTLSDPALLAEILGLDEEPILRPAYVEGFECKLWGQYPALVSSGSGSGSALDSSSGSGSNPGSVVEGAAYHVQSVKHAERLASTRRGVIALRPVLLGMRMGRN